MPDAQILRLVTTSQNPLDRYKSRARRWDKVMMTCNLIALVAAIVLVTMAVLMMVYYTEIQPGIQNGTIAFPSVLVDQVLNFAFWVSIIGAAAAIAAAAAWVVLAHTFHYRHAAWLAVPTTIFVMLVLAMVIFNSLSYQEMLYTYYI